LVEIGFEPFPAHGLAGWAARDGEGMVWHVSTHIAKNTAWIRRNCFATFQLIAKHKRI
jgi:hypothetical protein